MNYSKNCTSIMFLFGALFHFSMSVYKTLFHKIKLQLNLKTYKNTFSA